MELNYLVVDKTAKLGTNVKLDDFVSIRPGAVIGDHVEIKCRATIGKNCTVGNNVFIGAHSILCNGKESPQDSPSHVLDRCFIGAMVTVLPNVTIGPDVIIGAGSVVVQDATEKGTYAGNPCKRII